MSLKEAREELNLEIRKQELDIRKEKNAIENEKSKWTNRRIMAYMSLMSIFIFTAVLFTFVPESKLGPLGDVISVFYIIQSGIVASYFGMSTFEAVKLRK